MDGNLTVAGYLSASSLFVNDATGYVGIGTVSPSSAFNIVGENSDVIHESDSTTSGYGADYNFYRSNSGGLVADDDKIGGIRFRGSDGAGYDAAAAILSRVDGTPSAGTDMPARIEFHVAADNGVVDEAIDTPEMIIKNTGNIGIGTSTPQATLDIAGNTSVSGNLSVGDSVQLFATPVNGWFGASETALRLIEGGLDVVSDDGSDDFRFFTFSSWNKSDMDIFRARGTSTAPTIVQDGDELGSLRFWGYYDATSAAIGASVRAYVDGTPGVAGDVPTRLEFHTRNDGAQGDFITNTAMALNSNGDVTLSNHLSVGGSLSIPASTAPIIVGAGYMGLETDANALNISAGDGTDIAAGTAVAMPLIIQKDITIMQPQTVRAVSDAIPFIALEDYNYANGITLVAIRVSTAANSALSVVVEEWTSPTSGSASDLETITLSGAESETTIERAAIADTAVAAGNYIFLDLDNTSVDWLKVTIWYYVND